MDNRVKSCLWAMMLFALTLSGCNSSDKLINSDWYEVETPHFRIVTNGNTKKVEQLATDLERFRLFAQKYINVAEDQQQLTIYALADRLSFAGFVGDEKSRRTIGYFQNTSHGSFALLNLSGNRFLPGNPARQTLFHEYTHFLTYGRSPYHYPYWFSEGIAEVYSTVAFNGRDEFEVGQIPIGRAISLDRSKVLPLKQLLAATTGSLDDEDTEALYATGWMLTHWMIFDPKRQEALSQYIQAYNAGADPVTAFPAALGMTFDELDSLFRELPRTKFGHYRGHLAGGDANISSSGRPIPREVALAEIAHLMAITGKGPAALQEFITFATQQGASSPALTAALAIAETDAGNFARAKETIKTIPDEFHRETWFLEASAQIALSKELAEEGDIHSDMMAVIRDQYVQLVNARDDVPAYWHGLAITQQLLGYPRQEYLKMLEQAYLRAPRDVDIAWWYAHELYVSRDWEVFPLVARALMMQISSQESRTRLASMMQEMQNYKDAATIEETPENQLGSLLSDYRKLSGHKALALVLDYRGAFAVGYVEESPSQRAANDVALRACEKHRANHEVHGKCRLYAEGDIIIDPAAVTRNL